MACKEHKIAHSVWLRVWATDGRKQLLNDLRLSAATFPFKALAELSTGKFELARRTGCCSNTQDAAELDLTELFQTLESWETTLKAPELDFEELDL